MLILGIETSCDETAVALVGDQGVALNDVRSQEEAHRPYGGVVPEVASREHVRWLMPMVDRALAAAPAEIDAVAHTAGPGLVGCLVVGAATANAVAFATGKPVMAVNHLEGHVLSPLIENADLGFPYLCLLATGGHTQLVHARALHDYQALGSTLDDAVGECFDKVAFRLGIGYPGGARLEALAAKGDENAHELPVPMAGHPSLDLSFSGLKTAAARLIENAKDARRADIAASFQKAAVEALATKTEAAIAHTGARQVAAVGGVSRNLRLRERLQMACEAAGATLHTCSGPLCVDNAAMIAFAAHRLAGEGIVEPADPARRPADVRPRWPLSELGDAA